jgi:hypothetical protein
MAEARDLHLDYASPPLEWYIEVCIECGCQLGPGIGSRTSTGRCVVESHRGRGGIVIRVVARHPFEQDDIAARFLRNVPDAPRARDPLEEPSG